MQVGEPIGAGKGHITAGEFSGDDAQRLAKTILERFLVPVAPGACGVCGDGRHCTHTLAGTVPEPGPSVFGGPAIAGYAAAELVPDYFESPEDTATNLDRFKEIEAMLASAPGITIGGHVTAAAVRAGFTDPKTGVSKTGCGADDEFKPILAQVADNKALVDSLTATLIGDEYVPAAANYADKDIVADRVAGYDARTILDELKKSAGGRNVEILEGDHAEVAVVFDYVEGMTVDRDALVAETGKQVFAVDMWYVDKLARALSAGRSDAQSMYQKLKHALVAVQIGTYLQLADGSHRPIILTTA
jgi:hypothetical protein